MKVPFLTLQEGVDGGEIRTYATMIGAKRAVTAERQADGPGFGKLYSIWLVDGRFLPLVAGWNENELADEFPSGALPERVARMDTDARWMRAEA